MNTSSYMTPWLRNESLEALNRRIHDGVPLEKLQERADRYTKFLFETFFPFAAPSESSVVMEVGSGVGWIIESIQRKFLVRDITGLDISQNMIDKARERLGQENPAKFMLYDGLNVPCADSTFDNIYSVACLQHIEKPHAILLFKEIIRVLKSNGFATFHLMSVHQITKVSTPYLKECLNQVNKVDSHYMYFYSFDELFVIFHEFFHVKNLEIRHNEYGFWVSFSKEGERDFINDDLPNYLYLKRLNK